jgi:hypothetical protein
MNPWLLLGGAAAAFWLFSRKSEPSPATVALKVPTSTGAATVKVVIPSTTKKTTTQAPASVVVPDVNLLNDAETGILIDGTPDDIFNEAMGSYHKAFLLAAAAKLASMGDSRSIELAARAAESNAS